MVHRHRQRRIGSWWARSAAAVVAIGCIALGVSMVVRGAHSDVAPIPGDVPIVNAATGAAPVVSGPTATGRPGGDGPSYPTASSGSGPVAGAGDRTTTAPAAPSTAARPARLPRPDTVAIPSQQVSAAIVGACTIEGGTMQPPGDVHQTCRWGGGESLDVATGAGVTVITGHVNYVGQGPGAFARIGELHQGDALLTSGPDGFTMRWTVTQVVAYAKSGGIPERVFTRPDAQRRTLRLITCGGVLDAAGSYNDNIIVTAVAA